MATTTKTSLDDDDLSPRKTSPPKYSQEDNLTQECISLISTLPKDEGWTGFPYCLYKGSWHHSEFFQRVLTCQRHFQARNTDMILVTSPKSGTTWLKALAYAVVNRQAHSIRCDNNNHPLLVSNPHELVPFIEFKAHADLIGLPSPRVLSTHLAINSLPVSIMETDCKVVYLARDPKDVFISLWHFVNKLRPHQHVGKTSLNKAFDKFCKGVSICGPFWDHVSGYWKYSLDKPQKVFFFKFEDLKRQPELHLKRLAEFWGCPFSLEEENKGVVEEIIGLCSFNNLSNLEVNKNGKSASGIEHKAFFRKGEVGDWANYFTPEMTKKINEISHKKFLLSGLKF